MISAQTSPYWLTAFLDCGPDFFDESVEFWSRVTGHASSPRRGRYQEFASLVPPDGDEFLRVQRLGKGEPRIHLDLHVATPRIAADRALTLGATEIADRGYVAMSSPAGVAFCFVNHPAEAVPRSMRWPGGHRSRPHHLCLDVPAPQWTEESSFWSELMGAELDPIKDHDEFAWLRPHPRPWSALLLQRLDTERGPAGAHLDIASDNREAEVARHLVHGATLASVQRWWTVLIAPAGLRYCIVDKRPDPEPGP